jgi:hypothetical protein
MDCSVAPVDTGLKFGIPEKTLGTDVKRDS